MTYRINNSILIKAASINMAKLIAVKNNHVENVWKIKRVRR